MSMVSSHDSRFLARQKRSEQGQSPRSSPPDPVVIPFDAPTQQLVFHFAKHDEVKRMVAVMDIAVLLERLRDVFLADKSLLLGKHGSLSFNFINDIDMTFRVRSKMMLYVGHITPRL